MSTIGSTIVGFISTVFIAHVAGAGPLGAFYLLTAYTNILNLIADGGTGGAAVQRIAEGEEENAYFSAFAAVRLLLCLLTIGALLIARPFLVNLDQAGIFPWLVVTVLVGTASALAVTGVYGRGKAGVSQIADLTGTIVRVIGQVALVALGYEVAGLAGGMVAGLVAATLVDYRFLDLSFVRFQWRHLTDLWSFAVWSFLGGITAVVVGSADTILLGHFLPNSDVGFYRTAFQLATMALFTTLAVRSSLGPRISRWFWEGDIPAIEEALARAFTYAFLLAVPVCTGGWLLGGRLLYYLYGEPFVVATPALAVLFAVEAVTILVTLEGMCLGSMNRPRETVTAAAAAAVVLLLLDLLLIPLMGITGAAVGLLASMVMNWVLLHHSLKRQMIIRIEWHSILVILSASVVMGVGVLLYRMVVPLDTLPALLGAVLVGGVVYGVLVLRGDLAVHDEIATLVRDLGLPWPSWL
jgi:O-antigen/teichoic acid export membrane protein